MSKDDVQDAQWVSLLVDGELSAQDLGHAMTHLKNSDDVHRTWDSYHLIGDVMRSGQASARAHDPTFVQKLRQNLAQDTAEMLAVHAISITARGQKDVIVTSANDGWWRRVAGFASVALVSVLAWQGYALLEGHNASETPQLAQAGGNSVGLATERPVLAMPDAERAVAANSALPATSQAAVADEPQLVMLRDPRLDALLAAHRQFGGTSALQMPSGFLRNATFDEGQR